MVDEAGNAALGIRWPTRVNALHRPKALSLGETRCRIKIDAKKETSSPTCAELSKRACIDVTQETQNTANEKRCKKLKTKWGH